MRLDLAAAFAIVIGRMSGRLRDTCQPRHARDYGRGISAFFDFTTGRMPASAHSLSKIAGDASIFFPAIRFFMVFADMPREFLSSSGPELLYLLFASIGHMIPP